MARYDFVQTAFQRIDIEPARNLKRGQQVVEGIRRMELVQKPKSLLGKTQFSWRVARYWQRRFTNELRRTCGRFEPSSNAGHRGGFVQILHWNVALKSRTHARYEACQSQRVAAKIEKVILDPHRFDSSALGNNLRDGLFHMSARGNERIIKIRSATIWIGQRSAINFVS